MCKYLIDRCIRYDSHIMRPYQYAISFQHHTFMCLYIFNLVYFVILMYYFAGHMFFFTDLTIINGLFRLRSSSEINIIIRRVKVSSYIYIYVYRHPKKSGFLSPCLQEMFNYLSLTAELYLIQTPLIRNGFSPICISFYVPMWLNYHSNITFSM